MFCRDLHWSPFWVLLLAARFSQCLVASVDVRTFQDPPREYRPKFRYWLPDASVPAERVADDISNLASARAGGLEFLPFYLYGLPQVENPRPPTSWTEYGFGTPAFSDILKSSLQAANDSKVLIDFALGASEGQGVPLPPGTPGLAVELLMGNATVHSGQTFSGSVPQPAPVLSNLLSGAGFQLSLEQFGTPNLTAVSAMRVKSQTVENITIGDYVVPLETYVMDESSFIDLTPVARNGTLKWTAPADNSSWRVFTFWGKYTNQRSCAAGVNATNFLGNGSWTVDHFSKTGAKRITDFWDEYLLSDTTIASLLQTVGQYAWEDSMEMLASLYWTPGFLDRFEATCGYSLVKYLPAMFSYKNLWNQLLPPYLTQFKVGGYTADGDSLHSLDYRAVLNAGYKQYLTHFERWSHQRGFNYSSQPAYNIPLQMLSDVPLMDAPEGESLGFEDNIDAYRQFSGPAHLTGRNVLSSELGAVSTAAYSQVIPDLLFRLKRSLAGGMTMHVLHGFPYSGDYPQTTWPGYTPFYYLFTDMWNEKQPCWKHMPDVLDYIARNQLVLQQGVPQIDLAFYLYTSAWFPDTQYNSTNLESLGYTYDYLGPENLASNDAFVRDDLLGPDRAAYKALIIDNQNIMTVEAAKKIIRLTEAGLPVILVGAAPKQPYPYTEAEENKLAAEISKLLSLANVSQIDSNDALPGLLESLGITPRVSMICSAQGVHPLQRHNAERQTEYVYFYNDRAINVECNATIKMDGNVMPSWLNAWTGVEQQIVQYKLASDAITVPVNLKANQTNILALRAEDYSSPSNCKAVRLTSNVVSLNLIDNKAVVKVSGPASVVWSDGHIDSYSPTLPQTSNLTVWNIVIEDWHSSTNKSSTETVIDHHFFTLQHLVPWTDLGLKKVGGIGRYTTNLTIPTPEESSATTLGGILSLGPIVHTARVFIDSIQLPAIDPANPVVDITDYIKPGTPAELMVEVTTPLFNRIKADANSTMMVGVTAAQIQPLYASLDPKEYGLLGPVTVDWIAVENATCVAD